MVVVEINDRTAYNVDPSNVGQCQQENFDAVLLLWFKMYLQKRHTTVNGTSSGLYVKKALVLLVMGTIAL